MDSIFIPEEIVVDVKLNTKGKWNPKSLMIDGEERIDLGQILTINKSSVCNSLAPVSLALPSSISEEMELKLYTTIFVYEDERLVENDCCLNIPVRYYMINEKIESSHVNFWYDTQNSYPEIKSSFSHSLVGL